MLASFPEGDQMLAEPLLNHNSRGKYGAHTSFMLALDRLRPHDRRPGVGGFQLCCCSALLTVINLIMRIFFFLSNLLIFSTISQLSLHLLKCTLETQKKQKKTKENKNKNPDPDCCSQLLPPPPPPSFLCDQP